MVGVGRLLWWGMVDVSAVAALLAVAEERGRRDGWLSVSDVEQLGLFSGDRVGFWEGVVEGWLDRFGDGRVLLAGEVGYPARLGGVSGCPAFLFVRGVLPDDGLGSVAVVGSRRVGSGVVDAVGGVCEGLVSEGLVVVSGLARGVDSLAHRAVLDAGGLTVGVVGCGLDVVYPPENVGLLEEVVGSGGVVSQFPPGRRPSRFSFPARNRVVAGLVDGVVVMAAAERSGTRITMDLAVGLGRKVFLWGPSFGGVGWARRLVSSSGDVFMVGSVGEVVGLLG